MTSTMRNLEQMQRNAIVSDDSLGESSALADRLQLFKRKLNETWFSTPRFVYRRNVRIHKAKKMVCWCRHIGSS